MTEQRGIPCTTVARTLLDLARVVDRGSVAFAVREAEVLRIFDLGAVEAVLSRNHGGRGTRSLIAAVSHFQPRTLRTRRHLEFSFLELCADLRLPPPEVNTRIELHSHRRIGLVDECFEVDFAWRIQRLIVEADSHRFHGTRSAFERDRRRDQRLLRAGWRIIRCTWAQVARRDGELTGALLSLLKS